MNKTLFTLMMGVAVSCFSAYADSDVSKESREQMTPEGWTAVELPNITLNTTITLNELSSEADNAAAINAAITAANTAGGGMVVIPAGTWLSGPITMKSNVVLHLNANATLKMLPLLNPNEAQDVKHYPMTWDGSASAPSVFITNGGNTVNDVIIEGEDETSVIDGQGADWWALFEELKAKNADGGFKRPALIRITKGTRHLFRNFKIQNAPGTNLTLGQSGNASHMTVHDVTIVNPSSKDTEAMADGFVKADGTGMPSHNTDGIPVWGPYVNIYNCNISTGDDNVVFDSNSQYCHVWNCQFGRGHGASHGSYTEKMHDILWEDITFTGTTSGFRFKTNRDRSGNSKKGENGAVRNIICRNSTMSNVGDPIAMTTYYDDDKEDPASVSAAVLTAKTPEFCNILFQNITGSTSGTGSNFKHLHSIYMYGLPEMKIHDITFDNVQISADKGVYMAYCENIVFKNGCNIVKTNAANVFDVQYDAEVNGSMNGSANPSYDDGEVLGDMFSLVPMVTGSDVKVAAQTALNLYSPNVSISGGKAVFYNGHKPEANYDGTSAISPKGFSLSSSEDTYIKITLDKPLVEGDMLITTGQDGGVVSLTQLNKDAADNISNNIFTFDDSFADKNDFYVHRGSSKPLLTSISVVRTPAVEASVRALSYENKFWNFSDWKTDTISANKEQDGLTVVATSDKTVVIGGSNKTIDGIAFTQCLKFGGTGNSDCRHVKFPVQGPCTITVYVVHASNKAGDAARNLVCSFGAYGSNGSNEDRISIGIGDPQAANFQYNGDATTAYLYSENSGLNIYGIKVTYTNNSEFVYQKVALTKQQDGSYLYDGEIEIKDGEAFYTSLPFTARKISYSRAMSNQWGTLCLPFAITVNAPEEQPYDFFTVESASQTEGVLTLTRVAPGTLPAGTPVVVYRNASETGISFTEENAQVTRSPILNTTATNGLTLTGTFRNTTLQKGKGYYIASNKFWKATKETGVSVGAFRSYLYGGRIEESSAAASLRIVLADEEATGIQNTPALKPMQEGVLYDLRGQVVSVPLSNQVYILNGRKVMFK